jgi:hypothetical protein
MEEDGQQYVIRHGRRIAIKTLNPIGTPKRKRAEPFVMVPLRWAEQAARATSTPKAFVWLWLLHLTWKAKNNTVPLSNGQLQKPGVHRHTKARALKELEAAGLIRVVQGHRKTPVVTVLKSGFTLNDCCKSGHDPQ